MRAKTRFNPEKALGLVPMEYSLIKGCLSDYTISSKIPQNLTERINGEINQGVLIVNYAGHGSPQYWAHERILRTTHIPSLSNGQRLPVMVLMTCLNGYFVMPTSRSFAEEMLLADGAGAVAAFASRGTTKAQPQKFSDHGPMEAIFLAHQPFTNPLPVPQVTFARLGRPTSL